MTRSVEIRTGSRLHFGLFDTQSTKGRQGGIGMMVDRPGWHLRGSVAESDEIIADPATAERLQNYLETLRTSRAAPDGVQIEVRATIPPHCGLGSGTQLALALARLLRELNLLRDDGVLPKLGRGERSLVGTLGIGQGGFIIDPGEPSLLSDPRPRSRPVPETWRFVIVEPMDASQCSGETEAEAFAGLAPMARETRNQLAKLVERQILPGLEQQSFVDFAAGVAEFNRLVGEQFAPSQGGIYAHPAIRKLADLLKETDWPHLAQSSWGAAGVVFCSTVESAGRLVGFLKDRFGDVSKVEISQAAPYNHGAEVKKS